jgi:hypothetical protein
MQTYHATEAESNTPTPDLWEGYEECLDEIKPKLPPREGLINRIAWACTFSLYNFARLTDEGAAYLVPRRTIPRKYWRVTEQGGCECPDYFARKVCAHWLSIGAPSNGAFLVARILRARDIVCLEEVVASWRALDDPVYKTCPPEIELFAVLEYRRRKQALTATAAM